MKIKFMGTGTSHGVPVVGCSCAACASHNPKNIRYRASVLIESDGRNVVIDTPAEFRLRAIEYGINRVDAVLFTHAHMDHVAGLDDIRRYNELSGKIIPVYSSTAVLEEIGERFSYMFKETQAGGGKPKVKLCSVSSFAPFSAAGIEFLPLPVMHGNVEIMAYKTGGLAYITDVSEISDKVMDALAGTDVLVLDALRIKAHPTHFNLEQAIDAALKINAKKTYFTHIAHELEHEETEKSLPNNIHLAYDGLVIEM